MSWLISSVYPYLLVSSGSILRIPFCRKGGSCAGVDLEWSSFCRQILLPTISTLLPIAPSSGSVLGDPPGKDGLHNIDQWNIPLPLINKVRTVHYKL